MVKVDGVAGNSTGEGQLLLATYYILHTTYCILHAARLVKGYLPLATCLVKGVPPSAQGHALSARSTDHSGLPDGWQNNGSSRRKSCKH